MVVVVGWGGGGNRLEVLGGREGRKGEVDTTVLGCTYPGYRGCGNSNDSYFLPISSATPHSVASALKKAPRSS